jgi:hypothetical protein
MKRLLHLLLKKRIRFAEVDNILYPQTWKVTFK